MVGGGCDGRYSVALFRLLTHRCVRLRARVCACLIVSICAPVRVEYVEAYVNQVLGDGVRAQFEPFYDGFHAVCGGHAIHVCGIAVHLCRAGSSC